MYIYVYIYIYIYIYINKEFHLVFKVLSSLTRPPKIAWRKMLVR